MKKTLLGSIVVCIGLIVVACGTDAKSGEFLGSQKSGELCIEYRVQESGGEDLSSIKSSLTQAPCDQTGVTAECSIVKSLSGRTVSGVMYTTGDKAALERICKNGGGSFVGR